MPDDMDGFQPKNSPFQLFDNLIDHAETEFGEIYSHRIAFLNRTGRKNSHFQLFDNLIDHAETEFGEIYSHRIAFLNRTGRKYGGRVLGAVNRVVYVFAITHGFRITKDARMIEACMPSHAFRKSSAGDECSIQ